MVLYRATAWVPQCMGSQISMENEQNPIHQHKKNMVYNNKLNSKLVGSVPSLMDYQWLCSCGHILSAFTAHKRTVIQAKAARAKPVGAVPCVFCCSTKNNCKPWGTVLSTEIYRRSWTQQLHFVYVLLVLYTACLAVTNSTIYKLFSSVSCLMDKVTLAVVCIF